MMKKVSAHSWHQALSLSGSWSNFALILVRSGEDAEVNFESNWTQSVESFDEMGLKEDLLRGIYAFGFQEPSKIQEKGVLPVIQGRDTIA